MKYKEEIRFVIEKLERAGFEAYLVGGALRDLLLSREACDYDITTSASPEEMKRVFSGERMLENGLKHGTLTVIIGGMPIEITTFRVDGEYLDARHPLAVRFTASLSEDLARRDFTVNAMAYSEKTGLVDLYGGKADLEKRLVRAVGNPKLRFSEDALRILRAFRFASKLGFEIEEKTYEAIGECKAGLLKISAERISAELRGILLGENAVRALLLMRDCGVLSLVLPEAELGEEISALAPDFELRLAFLLRGADAEALSARLRALKLSNASAAAVKTLVSLAAEGLSGTDEKSVRRLIAKAGERFEALLALFAAEGLEVGEIQKRAACISERGDALSQNDLAIGGRDLIALGKKDKEVGETLSYLLECVLDDPTLNTKEKLLALAKTK